MPKKHIEGWTVMEKEPTTTAGAETTSESAEPVTESGFTPPASQEDLDRIIGERLKRERSKYADYEALKERAAVVDEIAGKLADAENRIKEFEAAAERSKWLQEVAAEFEVPAEVLRGDSLEELKAHAEAVKAALKPSGVYLPNVGNEPAKSKDSATAFVEREMFTQR